MRIAYVCLDPGVPVFGRKGCSIHVQEILRAMLQHKGDVDLFARRWGDDRPADLQGVTTHRLPDGSSSGPEGRERMTMQANQRLPEMLRQRGPFDLVYERHSLFSDAAMKHAAAEGIPGILEVNAPLIEEQSRHRRLVHYERAERAAQNAFEQARALIAVSPGVVDYLRRAGGSPDRVCIVPNGVDVERFGGAAPVARNGNGLCIGFVGTLKPWHDVATLIDAFARVRANLPESHLLIVGDGPQRETLVRQAAAHQLVGAVEFTGSVPHRDVPALLARMDVAVAPYPDLADFYFSPLKVYEYFAAGRAVIASRVGDLATAIQDGRTGLLVPPGDALALSNGIERLGTQGEFRRQLGRAAQQLARRHHGWSARWEQILQAAGVPAGTSFSVQGGI